MCQNRRLSVKQMGGMQEDQGERGAFLKCQSFDVCSRKKEMQILSLSCSSVIKYKRVTGKTVHRPGSRCNGDFGYRRVTRTLDQLRSSLGAIDRSSTFRALDPCSGGIHGALIGEVEHPAGSVVDEFLYGFDAKVASDNVI
ncbi:hypothetical protein EVAR_86622_1 [Eumeta japonica]|uniref:Uncharacterized protein n=1 Tax=Eumeta variegata TaxID=151549 RepID=A0A4C1VZW8_EUMVA|nr:hypothetical protein EVAR_86622_1 [Eumeta japonica]